MHLHNPERSAKSSVIVMNPSNQRIEVLRRLMQLEERRSLLQNEVDQIIAEIQTLQSQLLSSSGSPRLRRRLASVSNTDSKSVSTRRMGRGELRSQILDSLRAAGEKGVQVKELAAMLRIKPVNIHSWFHSALRRYPNHIHKPAPGRYVLVTNLDIPEPVRNDHGAPNTRRPAIRRARSRRGEIARQILGALSAAGREGISVQEIAAKIGANYRNIHVWFSSTGKKNPQIVKIGRGKFSLVSGAA